MNRVLLLVEGQTEEAFVKELLVPHYEPLGLYFQPIIASTRPGYRGGVTSYGKIRPQLQRLCGDSGAWVSTLFDLYALPDDFPGQKNYPRRAGGYEKALFLEQEWARDISCSNFIPNLLVHEFEALLFSDIGAFAQWMDDDSRLKPLYEVCKTLAPEEINEQPHSAPSKRIQAVFPAYKKTVYGPLIACDIGLDRIRQACPHFHVWLNKMEQLIP